MTKKKLDEIQINQSGGKAKATKTVKRLLPTVRYKFIIYFCNLVVKKKILFVSRILRLKIL